MNLLEELKRRNVIKVSIAYIVVGWLASQVAEFATENFGAPEWALKTFVVFLLLGLPFVVIFAWAFELTPEGIKREKDVDRSQSITHKTGRKLDFTIIGVLVLVAGYFIWESRFAGQATTPSAEAVTEQLANEPGAQATPTPADNSIAVLPFANRSNQDDDLFFTDGIHDDLLTQLAKIGGLKVISRTSVMEYRDTTKKIPEIAAELGVGKILEGGIQRAGKRIRINAQLIDVATDEHLWAETFDREMSVENIFDIQSEITRHIVAAVRGELTEAEEVAINTLPTDNLAAYEAYLQARAALRVPDYTMDKYLAAEPWLEQAVELDPEFARAWSLLVATHGQAVWIGYDDSPERLDAIRHALEMARQFGTGQAETLAAEAEYLYRVEKDFYAAETLYAQASQAKPGDADLLISLATTERRTGQFEQALTHFQMAIELDPAGVYPRSILVETMMLIGEFERAEPLADLWSERYPDVLTFRTSKAQILLSHHGDVDGALNIIRSMEPWAGPGYMGTGSQAFLYKRDYQGFIDFFHQPALAEMREVKTFKPYIDEALGRVYGYLGDSEKASKYLQAVTAFDSTHQYVNAAYRAYIAVVIAQAHSGLGQHDQAVAAIERARATYPESADRLEGPFTSIIRAWILGRAGQRDEALAEIERLLHTPAGLSRWDLHLSPDWDFFRDDPRFVELATPEGVMP